MTETKKPAAKKPAAPKAKTTKAETSAATVTVKQIGSPARSQSWAYDTLKGLGLGRINRAKTLKDSPEVRGMIDRVHHLVTVVEAA